MREIDGRASSRAWGVLPAAGTGSRFGAASGKPKQYLHLLHEHSVLEWSARVLLRVDAIVKVMVVTAREDRYWHDLKLAEHERIERVDGGETRAQSVLNALLSLRTRAGEHDWVVVHDGVRPCVPDACVDHLLAVLRQQEHPVGGILAVPVVDQLHRGAGGVVESFPEERDLWRAQTPQVFRYKILLDALQGQCSRGVAVRDEASAVLAAGHKPRIVHGSEDNIKITHPEDVAACAKRLESTMSSNHPGESCRIGHGMDIHAFGAGDHVMLAGVRIPCDVGVVAHSDGDVLLHALCDAILGACGLGDIGRHFPDTDEKWRDCESAVMVKACLAMAEEKGLYPHNVDLNLVSGKPKIAPYVDDMCRTVAEITGLGPDQVSIKATTAEGLGFVGREEGLYASAVVSMRTGGAQGPVGTAG